MSRENLLLGIDIGTTKIAAVIVSADGTLLADASLAHDAGAPRSDGRAEQDASLLLEKTRDVVRMLHPQLRSEVRAVGVTGQMHGVVLVDDSRKPVGPLVTWQDQRCMEKPGFLDSLVKSTGYPLRTGYGCATLAWLASNNAIAPNAKIASTIHDLLVAHLCAAPPVTDPTDAASWGLYDPIGGRWDARAISTAGIPVELLPAIQPSGSNAGVLCAPEAAAMGIPAAIPVAVAIGDNQASLIATLREPDCEMALTLGTGGQLSLVVPAIDAAIIGDPDAAIEYRPFPGKRFIAVSASLCGGAAWAWLADTIMSWQHDLGLPALSRSEVFTRMNDLGLAAPDGPVVLPRFLGERSDPSCRGEIRNIDLANCTLGSLARGVARGIVQGLRDRCPKEILDGRARVVGSGNALRRSTLLQKMTEDVFGLPLVMAGGREEAAVGAALNAVGN